MVKSLKVSDSSSEWSRRLRGLCYVSLCLPDQFMGSRTRSHFVDRRVVVDRTHVRCQQGLTDHSIDRCIHLNSPDYRNILHRRGSDPGHGARALEDGPGHSSYFRHSNRHAADRCSIPIGHRVVVHSMNLHAGLDVLGAGLDKVAHGHSCRSQTSWRAMMLKNWSAEHDHHRRHRIRMWRLTATLFKHPLSRRKQMGRQALIRRSTFREHTSERLLISCDRARDATIERSRNERL